MISNRQRRDLAHLTPRTEPGTWPDLTSGAGKCAASRSRVSAGTQLRDPHAAPLAATTDVRLQLITEAGRPSASGHGKSRATTALFYTAAVSDRSPAASSKRYSQVSQPSRNRVRQHAARYCLNRTATGYGQAVFAVSGGP